MSIGVGVPWFELCGVWTVAGLRRRPLQRPCAHCQLTGRMISEHACLMLHMHRACSARGVMVVACRVVDVAGAYTFELRAPQRSWQRMSGLHLVF